MLQCPLQQKLNTTDKAINPLVYHSKDMKVPGMCAGIWFMMYVPSIQFIFLSNDSIIIINKDISTRSL